MEFIKKNWFPILIVLILLIIIAVVVNNAKKPKQASNTVITPVNTTGLDLKKPLSVGSSGGEVKALQELINNAYKRKGINKQISTDGSFGTQTATAIWELGGTWVSSITLEDAQFKYDNYNF